MCVYKPQAAPADEVRSRKTVVNEVQPGRSRKPFHGSQTRTVRASYAPRGDGRARE